LAPELEDALDLGLGFATEVLGWLEDDGSDAEDDLATAFSLA
jgi:hypothetical protein